MEVTYRKNLNKSYMCVETQVPIVEDYELHMMECQKIPGLLNMQTVITDKSRRYYYDISGKQQIADYFSGQKLGYQFLQKLLFSIQGMCAGLPEYLLREEAICMDLEFIYVNLEDGGLRFTYLPFYQKSLPEAFQGCMEQLLRKIDHQDQEAVELGYQVYQACIQDNISIGRILETLLCKEEVSSAESQFKEHVQISEEQIPQEQVSKEEKRKQYASSKKGNLKQKSKKEKFDILPKMRSFVEQLMTGGTKVENYLPNLMKEKKEDSQRGKNTQKSAKDWKKVKVSKKEIQEYPIQQAKKEITNQSETLVPPTEILTAFGAEPMGKLVYQGIHACGDILIEGEIFLLGKNSAQVNGVVSAEGVSRLHARILRRDKQYFIEDLNSTNGTYLNDVQLEYHQPQALQRNDRIRFGAEEYIFL